ncbi:MAG: c-type cytochrome [Planctomycetota bacterium]|nr:c-type cytochrome [Planctomycetota bacterium]
MLTGFAPIACGAAVASLIAACSLRTPPPPGADGALIYELQNCANCHDEGLGGTSRGPGLVGLAQHWNAADLAGYLADPAAYLEDDERLQELEASHSGEMGPYANLTLDQRTVLARWLLQVAG